MSLSGFLHFVNPGWRTTEEEDIVVVCTPCRKSSDLQGTRPGQENHEDPVEGRKEDRGNGDYG